MDFTYNKKAISMAGPLQTTGRNIPINAKCRVERFSDIYEIPTPAVGELVYVLHDENNDNKPTLYVIISLKANEYGVENVRVDKIETLAEFLGISALDGVIPSDYYNKLEVDELLANKVSIKAGESLFTDEERAKLESLSNYDDTRIKQSIESKADKDHNHTVASIEGLSSRLNNKVDKVEGRSLVDDDEIARLRTLSNYDDTELRTKIDNIIVPTDLGQLTNGPGYLTSVPEEYVTETELDNKGYLTSVPEEYVTETELDNKGYLTSHQDISHLATKEELNGKANTDDVYDKVTVDQKITEVVKIHGHWVGSSPPTSTEMIWIDEGIGSVNETIDVLALQELKEIIFNQNKKIDELERKIIALENNGSIITIIDSVLLEDGSPLLTEDGDYLVLG